MQIAAAGAVALSAFLLPRPDLQAGPYASKVRVTGTTVSFILNEPADALLYRINEGPYQVLNGTTKGLKSFALPSATDNFSIIAGKHDLVGYTIPTGGIIQPSGNGLSIPVPAAGARQISDDSNLLTIFNSPRGVSVNTRPAATNFGTVYIANSASGNAGVRNLGDGVYALLADQSDAFGYGDTAQNPGGIFVASASSPFRIFAAANGEVYAADFSDANGCIYRLNGDLTTPLSESQILAAIGGPATLPVGQNHGSTLAVHVEGSQPGGNLTVYTLDEDLTSPGNGDRNSLWRYNINGGPVPFAGTPVRVNQSPNLIPLATSDMQRGADGKWYLGQNRILGNETGVFVLDPNGVTVFDSLLTSRSLLNNPTAPDILRNVQGIAVSEDQKWMAVTLGNSDLAVVPLDFGIPDLSRVMVVDTGADANTGRDIAFDAVGNIHYVSSGQAVYRVMAPGGNTWATTRRTGGNYEFSVDNVPDLLITSAGPKLRLDWPGGILQESAEVTGPWVDSATQASPYIFTPGGSAKFFKLRPQ